jgi:hypothetical protein
MFRRHKWNPLASLAAILGVSMVLLCLLVNKAQERTEFVGAVDPASGYRCRFTIASGWKHYGDGNVVFFCPAPSPLLKWMAVHLFHETADTGTTWAIEMVTETDGRNLRLWSSEKIVTQNHFSIDGCPATVIHSSLDIYGNPPAMTRLWVTVPDQPIRYDMDATVDSPDSDQIEAEMQAIISSFRVEKVAVPTGRKP